MHYEELTLAHFFREKEWHSEKLSKVGLREKVSELKKQIAKKEPRLHWKMFIRKLLKQVRGCWTLN